MCLNKFQPLRRGPYKFFGRALFLQDVSSCTSCKQADVSKLMEFELPAGKFVSDQKCDQMLKFDVLFSGMEESLRKLWCWTQMLRDNISFKLTLINKCGEENTWKHQLCQSQRDCNCFVILHLQCIPLYWVVIWMGWKYWTMFTGYLDCTLYLLFLSWIKMGDDWN